MRILKLAYALQLTIVPRHIAGQLNVLADLASRLGHMIPSKWSLPPRMFQISQSPWGPPRVDMFTNSTNHRLTEYISLCPDTEPIVVDALNCQWPVKVMYAFPPTCILQQFLLRLKTERQDSPGTAVEHHSQLSTEEENDPIPGGTGLAASTTLGSQPSEPRVSNPASGVPGEGRLKTLGFSDNVINRIGKSRASSTRMHYKS